MNHLTRIFPILTWGKGYNRAKLADDGLAAVIVTLMLIPQSLAYAMLAGLPPEIGLYASILPLVGYGLFGTSSALAVGPVAVISLMTAAAASRVADAGTIGYLEAVAALAFLSGAILVLMGVFRLGFLAQFLSHPVISGFITAAGLLIAAGQLRHLLGLEGRGHTLIETLSTLFPQVGSIHFPTLLIGLGALLFLVWVRRFGKRSFKMIGLSDGVAAFLVKAGPVASVVGTILIVRSWPEQTGGVALVGAIPSNLPALALPSFNPDLWMELLGAAVLLSLIGFVESVSVARTLAAKRRERVEPDQELLALGASNLLSATSGGYPVTGGFARSVVNFDAGAVTPAAGILTAIGIAVATVTVTPLLASLPKATLAATIIVAVLSIIDVSQIRRTFAYSKRDFAAMAATILATLLLGVEVGVSVGVLLSLLLFLAHTARPHVAVVGQVPGTEHFRNIDRHHVVTCENVVSIRVDESLYFANTRTLESAVANELARKPAATHVVLMCSAVNAIDASALESLEQMVDHLRGGGVSLHLSEVKGPVMDRLECSPFLSHMTGNIYLTQYDAMLDLSPDITRACMQSARGPTALNDRL